MQYFVIFFVFVSVYFGHNTSHANEIEILDTKTFEECQLDESCSLASFEQLVLPNNKVIKFNNKNVNIYVRGDESGKLTAILKEDLDFVSKIIPISFNIIPIAEDIISVHVKNGPEEINVLFSDNLDVDIDGKYSVFLKQEFGLGAFKKFYLSSIKESSIYSNCYGVWKINNKTSEMGGGTVLISTKLDTDLFIKRKCIVPNILMFLGFDRTVSTQATDLFFILRILYNENIKTGMTKEELEKVFPTVYKEVIAKKISYDERRAFYYYSPALNNKRTFDGKK